mmetsp:Transcript_31308/g.73494  ORF Transcript_31308/g.73494 Transcript_31308/m.73494 type:complete len:244 (-) Transcript_31308:78-809(-)
MFTETHLRTGRLGSAVAIEGPDALALLARAAALALAGEAEVREPAQPAQRFARLGVPAPASVLHLAEVPHAPPPSGQAPHVVARASAGKLADGEIGALDMAAKGVGQRRRERLGRSRNSRVPTQLLVLELLRFAPPLQCSTAAATTTAGATVAPVAAAVPTAAGATVTATIATTRVAAAVAAATAGAAATTTTATTAAAAATSTPQKSAEVLDSAVDARTQATVGSEDPTSAEPTTTIAAATS